MARKDRTHVASLHNEAQSVLTVMLAVTMSPRATKIIVEGRIDVDHAYVHDLDGPSNAWVYKNIKTIIN